jgi:hypothetical protein
MSGKLEDSYDKFVWFLHQSCLFSFVALLLIVGFVMFSSCVAFDHPLVFCGMEPKDFG